MNAHTVFYLSSAHFEELKVDRLKCAIVTREESVDGALVPCMDGVQLGEHMFSLNFEELLDVINDICLHVQELQKRTHFPLEPVESAIHGQFPQAVTAFGARQATKAVREQVFRFIGPRGIQTAILMVQILYVAGACAYVFPYATSAMPGAEVFRRCAQFNQIVNAYPWVWPTMQFYTGGVVPNVPMAMLRSMVDSAAFKKELVDWFIHDGANAASKDALRASVLPSQNSVEGKRLIEAARKTCRGIDAYETFQSDKTIQNKHYYGDCRRELTLDTVYPTYIRVYYMPGGYYTSDTHKSSGHANLSIPQNKKDTKKTTTTTTKTGDIRTTITEREI